jgi:hypothetical protein
MTRQRAIHLFHAAASLGLLFAFVRLFLLMTGALLKGDQEPFYFSIFGTWGLRLAQVGLECWVEWEASR